MNDLCQIEPDVTKTENEERRTGIREWAYNHNPPENSKWQTQEEERNNLAKWEELNR